jgi:hypothetical protein
MEQQQQIEQNQINQEQQLEQIGYRLGKIYQIKCNITNEVYIGSTFRTIEQRISEHKNLTNKCVSKQIIDRGDYKYEIIFESYFPNKTELRKLERYYIDNTNNCINKLLPYITEEEKKKFRKKVNKKYYEKNKEYFKQYNQKNKEQKNKEQDKEKRKENYQKNKEKIKEYKKKKKAERDRIYIEKIEYIKNMNIKIKICKYERFECECGGSFTKKNKSVHFKTFLHQQYEKSLNENNN